MAKLSCRSSVAPVSRSTSPVPFIPYEEFIDSLFSSLGASLNGSLLSKEAWRREYLFFTFDYVIIM